MNDSQAPIEPVKRSINSLTAFCKAIGATNPEVVGSATQTWLDPAILEEDPRSKMRIYESPKVQAHIASLVEAWMDNDHIPMVEVQVVDGRCYIRKGVCRIRAAMIARERGAMIMRAVLGTNDWALINAVIATVNGYLCSDLEEFHEDHLPLYNGRPMAEMPPAFIAEVFLQAKEVWRRMIDPQDTTVPHLHDAYLKLYYLSKPDLSDRFDVILADEAQDLNGITLGLIKNQSCRVIFVGDPHQSLYAFRGADNALSDPDLDDSVDLYLTKSFRFGPAVATVANIILSYKGEQLKIIGAGRPTQIKTQLDDGVRGAAYLCRTVSGVIMTALEFAPQGKTLYWVGGIEAYQIGDLEDLVWFSQGKTDKVRSKRLLKDFADWTSYLAMAKESKDREMARLIKVVGLFPDIEKRLARLRALTQRDEKDADVILSTAHRSKGLEWTHVYLGEDYPDPLDPELAPDARRDELNLLYVAATRAKHQLAINSVILGIMRDFERSRRRAIELAEAAD